MSWTVADMVEGKTKESWEVAIDEGQVRPMDRRGEQRTNKEDFYMSTKSRRPRPPPPTYPHRMETTLLWGKRGLPRSHVRMSIKHT